jgi:hypothetical protein
MMIRSGDGSLDAAAQRLSQALETLESKLQNRSEDGGASSGGDGDAERLRSELGAARERERALEEAAAEASAALGRAAEQIRVALEEEG